MYNVNNIDYIKDIAMAITIEGKMPPPVYDES